MKVSRYLRERGGGEGGKHITKNRLPEGELFLPYTLKSFICFLKWLIFIILVRTSQETGARGSVVVKALCCKPEGRGFKSR
jgi:hypothetical protein